MAIRRKMKVVPAAKNRDEWIDYPDWVVAQSEIPIEEADAGIAAIDDGLLGPGGLPPKTSDIARERGSSFAAAARAMREAEHAVQRSDWIVAKETARASRFVDDALGSRR